MIAADGASGSGRTALGRRLIQNILVLKKHQQPALLKVVSSAFLSAVSLGRFLLGELPPIVFRTRSPEGKIMLIHRGKHQHSSLGEDKSKPLIYYN